MQFDTNTVISFGLSIMGCVAVIGWIYVSSITGTSSGTEVPIAIVSGLTGVLTGKNMAESKLLKQDITAHTAENIITEISKQKVNKAINDIIDKGSKEIFSNNTKNGAE